MATIETSYRDPALSAEARVTDLLSRMTRAEKVAQLGSFWAFEVIPESGFDEARLAALASDGIGQITRLAGSTNLRPIAPCRNLICKSGIPLPSLTARCSFIARLEWAMT